MWVRGCILGWRFSVYRPHLTLLGVPSDVPSATLREPDAGANFSFGGAGVGRRYAAARLVRAPALPWSLFAIYNSAR